MKKKNNKATPDFDEEGFFEMFPDLLCIASTAGYFTRLNSPWEHTLGYTIEEFQASPFVVFIHPDDVEHTFGALERKSTAHEIICFDARFQCKDGSYKWLEWRAKINKKRKEIHAVVREITEWKHAMNHLKEKEAQYRTWFQKAPVGCQLLDANGNFIQVNQKWVETFGYSEEEIRGKWFGDFLVPEFIESFRVQFSLFKTRGNIHYESGMIRKDGTVIIAALDGAIANGPNGSFGMAHCTLLDITAVKQSSESLFKSEEKLRTIIESTDDAVLILDNEGKSIYANSKFTGMWGIPADKFGLGDEESLLGFVGNRLQELKKIHNRVKIESQCVSSFSDQIEFEDGRLLELRVHPWLLGNQVTGKVIYLRDITEKVRVENAIKESEERFRFLADYSPNMILIVTNGKIVYTNNQCEAMTGYSQEEIRRQGFVYQNLITLEFQGVVLDKFQSLVAGHPVENFEVVLISKKEEKINILINAECIQIGGVQSIMAIITDITASKQTEKITKQKVDSLEGYHNMMVGRELKMIKLKKEINKLRLLLGKKEKY